MKKNTPETIDIIDFIKKYPYIEVLKVSFYYIVHPIEHVKLILRKKDVYDIAMENILKKKENSK